MKKGTRFTASYEVGIFKAGCNGYRSETVNATFLAVSDKMAVVEKAHMNEAGSKRQQYHVAYYESKEIGKRKRIATLSNIEIIEE